MWLLHDFHLNNSFIYCAQQHSSRDFFGAIMVTSPAIQGTCFILYVVVVLEGKFIILLVGYFKEQWNIMSRVFQQKIKYPLHVNVGGVCRPFDWILDFSSEKPFHWILYDLISQECAHCLCLETHLSLYYFMLLFCLWFFGLMLSA